MRKQIYKCPRCEKIRTDKLPDYKGESLDGYDTKGPYISEIFCETCAGEVFKQNPKHKISFGKIFGERVTV